MSYRRKIQKQRRLEREAQERAGERGRRLRNALVAGLAAAALVGTAVIALVLGVPGGGGSGTTPVSSISISMADDLFDPDTITLKAGQKYKIGFLNQGQNLHNFWTSGPDSESGTGDDVRSDELAAGEIGSVEVAFDQPGTYGFSCTLHAGMDGELVVEPPPGPEEAG